MLRNPSVSLFHYSSWACVYESAILHHQSVRLCHEKSLSISLSLSLFHNSSWACVYESATLHHKSVRLCHITSLSLSHTHTTRAKPVSHNVQPYIICLYDYVIKTVSLSLSLAAILHHKSVRLCHLNIFLSFTLFHHSSWACVSESAILHQWSHNKISFLSLSLSLSLSFERERERERVTWWPWHKSVCSRKCNN